MRVAVLTSDPAIDGKGLVVALVCWRVPVLSSGHVEKGAVVQRSRRPAPARLRHDARFSVLVRGVDLNKDIERCFFGGSVLV